MFQNQMADDAPIVSKEEAARVESALHSGYWEIQRHQAVIDGPDYDNEGRHIRDRKEVAGAYIREEQQDVLKLLHPLLINILERLEALEKRFAAAQ